MQLLGNSLTREEVVRYLARVEKKITQLEGELILCPAGSSRSRAFLHRELAEAYTVADELRTCDPDEAVGRMSGFIGQIGPKGRLS